MASISWFEPPASLRAKALGLCRNVIAHPQQLQYWEEVCRGLEWRIAGRIWLQWRRSPIRCRLDSSVACAVRGCHGFAAVFILLVLYLGILTTSLTHKVANALTVPLFCCMASSSLAGKICYKHSLKPQG